MKKDMELSEEIRQKEKELQLLKEKSNKENIKEQQRSGIYRRIKSEVDELDSVLNSKSILHCPFCGGEGKLSALYDSDDNRPDGHQNYVECDDCLSQGESFYSKAISEGNLTQEQYIIQEKHRLEAMINAINAWNKRI